MLALILVVDRRKQASRVSSTTILFRVLLFICFTIEKLLRVLTRATKALSQMYVLSEMEHIFCAKSHKWGNCFCLQASKTPRSRNFFFLTKEIFRLLTKETDLLLEIFS